MTQYVIKPHQSVTLQLYSKAVAEKAKELQALQLALDNTLSDVCGVTVKSSVDKISFDQKTLVLTVEPLVRTI